MLLSIITAACSALGEEKQRRACVECVETQQQPSVSFIISTIHLEMDW